MTNSDKDIDWETMAVAQTNQSKHTLNSLVYKLKSVDPRITKVFSGYDVATHGWKLRCKFEDGFILDLLVYSEELENEDPQSLFNSLAKRAKALIAEKHSPKTITNSDNEKFIMIGSGQNAVIFPESTPDDLSKMLTASKQSALEKGQKVFEEMLKKQASGNNYIVQTSNPTYNEWMYNNFSGAAAAKALPPTAPEKDKEFTKDPSFGYFDALDHLYNVAAAPGFLTGEEKPYGPLAEKAAKAKAETVAKIKKQQAKLYQKNKGFDGDVVQDSLKHVLPCLYEMVACPACTGFKKKGHKRLMSEMIIHLNDTHDWTREAIADWAESLEIDTSVKGEEDNVARD